jgi:hypothetical protein
MHFQAYYLAAPFPIERAETSHVPGLRRASGAVTISQLSGYAVSSSSVTAPLSHVCLQQTCSRSAFRRCFELGSTLKDVVQLQRT